MYETARAGDRPTPASVALGIGEPSVAPHLAPGWRRACEARPSGPLEFLDPARVPERRGACRLPEDADPVLRDVAARVADDPCLSAFAWYLHWRLFLASGLRAPTGLPDLRGALGPLGGAFYELVALEFPAALGRYHQTLGFPADATRDTIAQVGCFDSNHRRGEGICGIYPSQFPWLRNYLLEPYVRLGRFEFQCATAGDGVRAFRRADGTMVLLARDGASFDAGGLELPAGSAEKPAWKSRLACDGEHVVGTPIDPSGHAIAAEVRLSARAWEPFIAPGVEVLNLHIPAGGGMTFEACRDSFARAHAFFTRFCTERRPVAVQVGTWFLDPQVREVLPDSNAARLQRALYCHPITPWASGDGGLWFVFLRSTRDPASLPRDTSMRRALADHLARGGTWRGGGMAIPFDEADDLRQDRYREAFDRVRAELGLPHD